MRSSGVNRIAFWVVGASVVILDIFTKVLAVQNLSRVPRPVLGDWLTLQLVYNPGAAFGLNVGPYSRWVFLGLALVASPALETPVG